MSLLSRLFLRWRGGGVGVIAGRQRRPSGASQPSLQFAREWAGRRRARRTCEVGPSPGSGRQRAAVMGVFYRSCILRMLACGWGEAKRRALQRRPEHQQRPRGPLPLPPVAFWTEPADYGLIVEIRESEADEIRAEQLGEAGTASRTGSLVWQQSPSSVFIWPSKQTRLTAAR